VIIRDDIKGWSVVSIEMILAPLANGNILGQGWSPQCEKEPSPSENEWGVLKTTAIQAGFFLERENKHLPKILEPRPHLEVKTGDLLITCAGPRSRCGVACLVRKTRKRLMISGKMYRFRTKEEVASPEFVETYLQSREAWEAIDKMKTGGSDSGLNLTHERFKKLQIPLPPLPEQHRIVEKIEALFSELENGIEQVTIAQQQLKVYRQAVLKWAFEGKLTNEKTADGELPKAWKWVKLGDVCSGVEYGSAAKSKETGKVPVLRMGNIQNGRFDWGDLVFTDDKAEIKKYWLKRNDVLFNRTNSAEWVGKTAIYKGERPAIFAGYLIRINRIEHLIDADYLTYFLNSHFAKSYGNTVRSFGVNQSNINGTKLKGYPLPLPPIAEQQQVVQEIESRLSVCDKLEETITASLHQAEAAPALKLWSVSDLRQSILKKAFEGKLVPQDPIDEPAGVLVERIRAEKKKRQHQRQKG
jgi:type I restriction enzyme S subunit